MTAGRANLAEVIVRLAAVFLGMTGRLVKLTAVRLKLTGIRLGTIWALPYKTPVARRMTEVLLCMTPVT